MTLVLNDSKQRFECMSHLMTEATRDGFVCVNAMLQRVGDSTLILSNLQSIGPDVFCACCKCVLIRAASSVSIIIGVDLQQCFQARAFITLQCVLSLRLLLMRSMTSEL
jgi:hypothetical protein